MRLPHFVCGDWSIELDAGRTVECLSQNVNDYCQLATEPAGTRNLDYGTGNAVLSAGSSTTHNTTANMARKISRRIPKGHFKKRPDLMYWVDDEQPEEFDFTFDCPVCVVQSGGCGFLALNKGFCIWTDRDAAETYLERAADALPDNPSGDTLDVVEIESDSDLLDLLMRHTPREWRKS